MHSISHIYLFGTTGTPRVWVGYMSWFQIDKPFMQSTKRRTKFSCFPYWWDSRAKIDHRLSYTGQKGKTWQLWKKENVINALLVTKENIMVPWLYIKLGLTNLMKALDKDVSYVSDTLKNVIVWVKRNFTWNSRLTLDEPINER